MSTQRRLPGNSAVLDDDRLRQMTTRKYATAANVLTITPEMPPADLSIGSWWSTAARVCGPVHSLVGLQRATNAQLLILTLFFQQLLLQQTYVGGNAGRGGKAQHLLTAACIRGPEAAALARTCWAAASRRGPRTSRRPAAAPLTSESFSKHLHIVAPLQNALSCCYVYDSRHQLLNS
jgi:hypothetical protein